MSRRCDREWLSIHRNLRVANHLPPALHLLFREALEFLGELPTGVMLSPCSVLTMSVDFITSVTAAESLAVNVGGVLGGATSPNQTVTKKPGNVSATVGTFGCALERCLVPIAKSLSRPAWMCCEAAASSTNIRSI